jgi:hypothetical protein
VTETLDAIKVAVAARHGLSDDAARFLVGQDVEQIEQSAGALGRLIAAHGKPIEPEPDPQTTNFSAAARAEKAKRQTALVRMLTTGSPKQQQPRDSAGRFASFDGGARSPVPRRRDPVAEHGQLIGQLANLRRFGGI